MNIIQRQEYFLDNGIRRNIGLPYQYIFLLTNGEMLLTLDRSCLFYIITKEVEPGINECICAAANQILGEFHNV